MGYSLPSDDINVRSTLVRAVQGRERTPQMKLVFNRDRSDVFARYRLLFPQAKALFGAFAACIEQLPSRESPNGRMLESPL